MLLLEFPKLMMMKLLNVILNDSFTQFSLFFFMEIYCLKPDIKSVFIFYLWLAGMGMGGGGGGWAGRDE